MIVQESVFTLVKQAFWSAISEKYYAIIWEILARDYVLLEISNSLRQRGRRRLKYIDKERHTEIQTDRERERDREQSYINIAPCVYVCICVISAFEFVNAV